jgi:hypothetical protein
MSDDNTLPPMIKIKDENVLHSLKCLWNIWNQTKQSYYWPDWFHLSFKSICERDILFTNSSLNKREKIATVFYLILIIKRMIFSISGRRKTKMCNESCKNRQDNLMEKNDKNWPYIKAIHKMRILMIFKFKYIIFYFFNWF